MASQFEYNYLQTATAVLEIENIGKCALCATNMLGEEYYLAIRTSLGKSYIFKYGPLIPDLDTLPPKVSCSVERMDYKEEKIKKIIGFWLEDPKKKISNAEEIDDQDLYRRCRDLIAYMRNYTTESGED